MAGKVPGSEPRGAVAFDNSPDLQNAVFDLDWTGGAARGDPFGKQPLAGAARVAARPGNDASCDGHFARGGDQTKALGHARYSPVRIRLTDLADELGHDSLAPPVRRSMSWVR